MIEFVQADLFQTPADIRVNAVNCVGIMGAGIALAFKRRYPAMFRSYRQACRAGRVRPGSLHVWTSPSGDRVINLPTKRHWRDPSRYDDVESGLDALRDYLRDLGAVSVALPALGCGLGGLDWAIVSRMIAEKLAGLDARILVHKPGAPSSGSGNVQRP